jgi:hypothetical protein
MIWVFLYVLMIVATPIIVVRYHFDPIEDELYKKEMRNFLLGGSVLWPVLWFFLLAGLVGRNVVRPIGVKIHALLDELDPGEDSEE